MRLRPAGLVSLILLIFGIVWLTHLSYTSLSPPTDNIEQLTWVGSLEGGYYKHPPLPTWLFWLPVKLFGATAWTSYVVGATFTLGALALLWRLLLRMRGWRYATLALLAVLCITDYNGRLYYYDHNVVLMFFVTASAALCWKPIRPVDSGGGQPSAQRWGWGSALNLFGMSHNGPDQSGKIDPTVRPGVSMHQRRQARHMFGVRQRRHADAFAGGGA